MKVSIKDVAKAAGVSHSTVSRALSNNPLIAEKTRQRVERIAQKLRYTPNAIARGLVTQQTRAIGVIVTSIADPFVADVVRGIEQTAGDNGYRVVLGTSHNDPEREINSVKALREWRVDSVIVESSRVGSLYGPLLQEIGVPIVLINSQQPGTCIRSVMVDDVQGAKLATNHLIALGHRVIGHIRGPAGYRATTKRLAGYRMALKKAGIPFDPMLLQAGNGRADASDQAVQLLSRSPRPTAIFCYNDMTAIGALRALKRSGIRVPQDISLVGFDDIQFAMYTDPPLTTIHQPTFEMGKRAMEMTLTLMNTPRAKIENVVIQGELIVRESSAKLE